MCCRGGRYWLSSGRWGNERRSFRGFGDLERTRKMRSRCRYRTRSLNKCNEQGQVITYRRYRSAQEISPSRVLTSTCALELTLAGSPRSSRKVDPLLRFCSRPSLGDDGGEFENALDGKRPCSSYMSRRLATEGSERSRSSWLLSLWPLSLR